jgi:hypothetical protein
LTTTISGGRQLLIRRRRDRRRIGLQQAGAFDDQGDGIFGVDDFAHQAGKRKGGFIKENRNLYGSGASMTKQQLRVNADPHGAAIPAERPSDEPHRAQ